jgi:hypothetical protein
MTIRELKNDVEALGFSRLCELEDDLVYHINRALFLIHTNHPKICHAEISHFPTPPIFKNENLVLQRVGSEISVPVGRLSMKLQGEGEYTIEDGAKTKKVRFSEAFSEVDIDFSEGGRLVFSGGGSFSAWDIEIYERPPFPCPEAVRRTGKFTEIDLKKLFPEMLYIVDLPMDKHQREIHGLKVSDGGKILVPRDFRGVIYVDYRAKGEHLEIGVGEDAEINISPELSPLLPLLCAHFIWLDSEPDKAKEYLDLYEDLSRKIKRAKLIKSGPCYKNTTRWA